MALPRGAMSLSAVCNCGTHLLFMDWNVHLHKMG